MPNLLEIATVLGRILNILLEPLKDISRLVKKFKMLPDKSFPFSKLYKEDKELIELQQKINNGRIIKLLICLLVHSSILNCTCNIFITM